MMERVKTVVGIVRETVREFMEDSAMRIGAALAFYSMFSLAPLLVLAVAIAGFIWGEEAAQDRLRVQLEQMVGPQGAGYLQEMVASSRDDEAGWRATLISIGMLLFGATVVVVAIKDALNAIWGVRPDPDRGWWWTIIDRLFAGTVVLVVGLLLFLSMILASVLSFVGAFAADWFPMPLPTVYLINWTTSLVVSTLLFAALFRLLPDVKMQWRDVWVGALVTAVLFMIGKELIAMYLGRVGVATTYGAAGSLAALLVWIYYSALIFLFGAEFTQVYARTMGKRIEPSPGAVRVTSVLRGEDAACRDHEERGE